MNLGDFKQQISDNIRRGTSLDARIPTFIRQAARWIERNRTLQYMKTLAEIEIDLEVADNPRYIELAGTLIKSVLWFRWIDPDDNSYIYLKNWDPTKFTSLEEATPRYYFLNGVSQIVLTSDPQENLAGELQVARYSSWPTSDTATHWLMDNAEDVLEAQTMIQVGKYTRDADLQAHWKAIRDEGLVTLYAAEQEFEFANVDLQMAGE